MTATGWTQQERKPGRKPARIGRRIAAAERLEVRRLLSSRPVTYGSAQFDTAYSIATMPDNSVVVAGLFSNTADFDPTPGVFNLTSQGDSDAYVARYSSSGALMWAIRFGGTEGRLRDGSTIDTPTAPSRAGPFDFGVGLDPAQLGEYASSVVADSSGNVYVTGSFRGTVNFNPNGPKAVLSSIKGSDYVDIFLLKLTAEGQYVYVRQLGGRFTDVAQELTIDEASGTLAMIGFFTRNADFDPSPKQAILSTNDVARQGIFVGKYTASAGNLVWVRAFQTDETRRVRRSVGNGVAMDGSGNVFVTGSFAGETDFDPSSSGDALIEPDGETDAFIVRLTAATGALGWVKTFGGDQYDGGVSIALSPDGTSLYTAAYFEDTIDADPGPAILNVTATPEDPGDDPERSDILVSKFDAANGALEWARQFGSDGWEPIGAVRVSADDSIFMTGAYYNEMDADPGAGEVLIKSVPGVDDFRDRNDRDRENSYDGFIVRLDANGVYEGVSRFGAASDDYSLAMAISESGGPVVAGQFKGTVQLGNGLKLRPYGNEDSYILSYDEDLVMLSS